MNMLKKYFILLLFILPQKPEPVSKIANEKSKLDNELALKVKADPSVKQEQSSSQFDSNLSRIEFLKTLLDKYKLEAKKIWADWIEFVKQTATIYGNMAPLGFRLQLVESLKDLIQKKAYNVLNPRKFITDCMILKRDMLQANVNMLDEALGKSNIQDMIIYLMKNVVPQELVWEYTDFKIPNPLEILNKNSQIAHLNSNFSAKNSITKQLALAEEIKLGEITKDDFKATLNPFKELALEIDAEEFKVASEVGVYTNELKSAVTAEKAKIENEIRKIELEIQQENITFSNLITDMTNELLKPEV